MELLPTDIKILPEHVMIFVWTQVIFALVLWPAVCFLSVFHPIQEQSLKQIKSTRRYNILDLLICNYRI